MKKSNLYDHVVKMIDGEEIDDFNLGISSKSVLHQIKKYSDEDIEFQQKLLKSYKINISIARRMILEEQSKERTMTIKECGTYRMPDLEMTKDEEIDNLARTLSNIKPLLDKFEIMENNGYENGAKIMTKSDFSNLWYYKYKNLYFYHELLELLNGDREKLAEIVKNWKPSGGMTISSYK